MSGTQHPYNFDIETLLSTSQPDSILAVGEAAMPTLRSYVKQKAFLKQPCQVTEINDLSAGLPADIARHDTGVVVGVLEHLSKSDGLRLLAQMRDLLTKQFCVVIRIAEDDSPDHNAWHTNELLGLGLSLLNRYQAENGELLMFTYDITTYKKTPDWFNAGNWANPELWDKYRW